MKTKINSSDFVTELQVQEHTYKFYSLKKLEEQTGTSFANLPYAIRVLIENSLRKLNNETCTTGHLSELIHWQPQGERREIPFYPARIVLQDLTGVPVLVDLASMRDRLQKDGKAPSLINPRVPTALVIDHSVQVDFWSDAKAREKNEQREFQRNNERYRFLKWAKQSFSNLQIVPPGTGIIHQINTEYFSQVAFTDSQTGFIYPDTCVGTDSHTPMINGLGVLGWGVGGIEAESAMLGEPLYFLCPDVVGINLSGALPAGVCATDLVLYLTELLRKSNVVGKFVEFYGTGLSSLSVFDRATVSNMAPEQGSTVSLFPVDQVVLDYLKLTGRESAAQLVEAYFKAQGLFYSDNTKEAQYSQVIDLDLSEITPSVAGPKKPHQRQNLSQVKTNFAAELSKSKKEGGWEVKNPDASVQIKNEELSHGSVVLAAITSCTNTANPEALVAAGLLARNALERGLHLKSYVKASFSPGSKATTAYLKRAGLLNQLEKLGFFNVGYGCMTCIGNSGPIDSEVSKAITEKELVAVAVISGNRNFEGRVHPFVRANYLVSPALVVAYALAGSLRVDLSSEPIGQTKEGADIYLKDIWPTPEEVTDLCKAVLSADLFQSEYHHVFDGPDNWKEIPVSQSELYPWDSQSTYIAKVPFVDKPQEIIQNIAVKGARALAVFGDFITTDHISPAGNIPLDSPAGRYLTSKGVKQDDFNSYGSRRGNHEVMVPGTFANIRIKNLLVSGREGNLTRHFPTNQEMTIFDASELYRKTNTPLIILAGKEYGSGSSRDWAAKGPALLGVKAVIAQSFERIHRSNLIGMGILPLQFLPNESRESLGLSGEEAYDIVTEGHLVPGNRIEVRATTNANQSVTFQTICRIDFPVELKYFQSGGLLPCLINGYNCLK